MTPISLNDTGQGGCRALRINPDRVAPGLGSRVAITDGVAVVERHDGMAMPLLELGQPGHPPGAAIDRIPHRTRLRLNFTKNTLNGAPNVVAMERDTAHSGNHSLLDTNIAPPTLGSPGSRIHLDPVVRAGEPFGIESHQSVYDGETWPADAREPEAVNRYVERGARCGPAPERSTVDVPHTVPDHPETDLAWVVS
jgi:hypothetical protein